MKRRNKVILYVLYILLTKLSLSLGDELQIIPMPSDAEKSWNEYAATISHCQGTQTTVYKWFNTDGSIQEQETRTSDTISIYPFIVSSFHKNDRKQHLFGSNKRYDFNLQESEKNKWIISSLNPNFEKKKEFSWNICNVNDDKWINSPEYYIVDTFATSFNLAGLLLPILIKNSDFTISEYEETSENDVKKVTVFFTYSPEVFLPSAPLRKGKIVFLPDSFWVVESMEIFLTNAKVSDKSITPTKLTTSFKYDYSESIPLLVSSLTESRTNNRLVWSSEGLYDLKLIKENEIPLTRFTLSAYGLPEPDFGESRASRMRYKEVLKTA